MALAHARLIVYLLDTNHCSRLIDRDPGVLQRLRELGDARLATCVVVRGELRFMVERSERRHENAVKVEALLGAMEVFPLDAAANGIHLLENLKLGDLAAKRAYGFAFVMQPLKLKGGTGSTVAPIAIR